MRVDSRYSKFVRCLLMIGVFSAILIYLGKYLSSTEFFDVDVKCRKLNQTMKYCFYSCNITSERNASGRITITHTIFVAIFDRKINVTENTPYNLLIQIPYRGGFLYDFRVMLIADEVGNVYGGYKGKIKC